MASIPAPVLDRKYWMDSDASTFKVRSATYLTDKEKCRSAPALFKFIGIDLFETNGARHNIASHPSNRVFLAKERGEDSWVFIVNIMVPGSPYINFVSYFVGDKVRASYSYSRICCTYTASLAAASSLAASETAETAAAAHNNNY